MREKLIIIIGLLSAIAIFSAYPSVSLAESGKLTIVFSGDMRGELENCRCPTDDFGGLDRRAKYISEVIGEAGDILLLDVGDVLQLATADIEKKEIARAASISFKAMGIMGYDVMNVGESDVVLGEDFLSDATRESPFSLISANIINRYTKQPFFKPYVIKTMDNGLRVGILGLVNERYVLNSDRLDIAPNKEIAARYIPELRPQCDVLIVLGHLGMPYSINLAESFGDIDIILNGHWDVDSQEPIKVGDTLVMPTTYHSRKIGRLDVDVSDGKIASYKWESMPLDNKYDGMALVEGIIAEMSELDEEAVPEEPQRNITSIGEVALERPLRVLVFYSAGCRACMEIEKDLLPDIELKYGDNIVIENYDIGLPENYEQMTRLEHLYGVEGGYVPEVVVSRYVLMGKDEIMDRLDEVIHDALEEPVESEENKAPEAAEYHAPADSLILSRFESFSLCAVTAAGLLDGVNPCAFTTIVFFISFLAFVGYKKREMFFAGASFTTAVFIAYLLIGLGIFRFLRAMRGFAYVTVFINILIGSLAFLLAALNIIDYFRYRKTKDAKSTILKLPKSIKDKIHSVIGTDFRSDRGKEKKNFLRIIWIAFIAGFMVSVLESFCTGQVYLPTLAFVLKMPDKKMPALLYLILYNLAFITPLIVVFILGLIGTTSGAFSRFMEKRMGAVKIATAALFLILGSVLIFFR